jgi:hypothetical protein
MFQLRFKTPVLSIAGVFILTVFTARLNSWFFPRFHWEPVVGLHIHHYVYGIFMLSAAGYLALIFKGPRATFWIALLYGLGIGLTFDEFGMWLNPPFQRGTRWNYSGLTVVVVALVLSSLIPLLRARSSRAVKAQENVTDAVAKLERGAIQAD